MGSRLLKRCVADRVIIFASIAYGNLRRLYNSERYGVRGKGYRSRHRSDRYAFLSAFVTVWSMLRAFRRLEAFVTLVKNI